MSKMYLSNAFSLNMVVADAYLLDVEKYSKEKAAMTLRINEFTCAIGHKDVAAIVSSDLGLELEANRINVSMDIGDVLLIAQYKGPRLPEGTTALPEGAKIEYFMCVVQPSLMEDWNS